MDDTETNFMAQLGRVAAEDSFLQLMLEGVIWEVCEVPRDLGETLTGGMSFRQLIETACAVTDVRKPETQFRGRFEAQLKVAEETRNRLLHSRWTTVLGGDLQLLDEIMGLDGEHAMREKYARRANRVTSELVSIDELRSAANTIQRLALDIGEWVSERFKLSGDDLENRWWSNLARAMEAHQRPRPE